MLRTVATIAARRASGLGACRAFATAKPAIEWEDIEKFVKTDQGKRDLTSLRATFSDVSNRLSAIRGNASAVDLKEFEGLVDADVIAEYKKGIAAAQWPTYPGKELEEAEAAFVAVQKEADALLASSEKQIAFLTAELKQIEELKRSIRDLTVDDYLAKHPELAAEIDREAEQKSYIPW